MARLHTRFESEAAEFLVLGHLLLHRIATFKAYTNMAGYDLVATDPDYNSSARIQVKSRWRSGAAGFPLGGMDWDFCVCVQLNRGNKAGTAVVAVPEYFVFPKHALPIALLQKQAGQLRLRAVAHHERYRERWDLISNFLRGDPKEI